MDVTPRSRNGLKSIYARLSTSAAENGFAGRLKAHSRISFILAAALCMGLAMSQPASAAGLDVPSGSSLSLAGGSLNLTCGALTVEGTYNVDSGQISNIGGVTLTGGTLNGGSGLIGNGGNWDNAGNFVAGTGTVVMDGGCSSPVTLSGDTVFNNLTLTSTTGTTFVLPAGHHITVNGTLTLQGANGSPIQLISSSGQPAYVTFGPSANLVSSYANYPPNVILGASTTPVTIPTLNGYGLTLLALLLGLIGLKSGRFDRRSRRPECSNL